MPPLQGGEMLYPTFAFSGAVYDGMENLRKGIIDARGALVAPAIYAQLNYVTNAAGDAVVGLMAGALEAEDYRWVYYGLDGSILAEPDYRGYMYAFPGGRYAETSGRQTGWMVDENDVSGGLWSLEENRQLLAPAHAQSIRQLDAHRFFVRIESYTPESGFGLVDMFIFDADSGARTAVPSDVFELETSFEAALIRAADENGTWGLVDSDLHWVVPLRYSEIEGLQGRRYRIARDFDGVQYLFAPNGAVLYEGQSSLTAISAEYVLAKNDATGETALLRVTTAGCATLLEPAVQGVSWLEGDRFVITNRAAGTTTFWDAATGKATDVLQAYYDNARNLTADLVLLERYDLENSKEAVTILYNCSEKRAIPLPAGANYAVESLCPWVVCVTDYNTNTRLFYDGKGNPLGESGAGQFNYTGLTTVSTNYMQGLLPAYPWVTQGLYAGYVDQNGGWIYKQERYLGLED
jgi:hypothetical protein